MSSRATYPPEVTATPSESKSGHQVASRASMSASDMSEPRLERGVAPGAGVAVLELAGELDLAVSGRLRELVDEATAERPALVVADLTEVGFMDSSILREMLRAHREIEEAGGRFVVAAPQATVRRLLELTGTVEVFTLAGSREDALAS
jgi:anti-anti-sigma factor